jgi:hypothetical protein
MDAWIASGEKPVASGTGIYSLVKSSNGASTTVVAGEKEVAGYQGECVPEVGENVLDEMSVGST